MPVAGSRLGPYEMISPLGAGGMGEVWRARDTRLDRHVAIKLLPADLSQHDEYRRRLEAEARAISQLNDPRICTLYDIGREDGHHYLVMELLEGETLQDRIASGALSLEETLRIGIEIATGLERAHAAGIVHRDLKPGNVMLTKSGAKLLDFGLAKSDAAFLPRHSQMTERMPLTQEGTIVGTFHYMSPEQLEGEPVDARTDLFALGAILYEMITGRRAFEGKTRTSVIAAIVDRDPAPISTIRPLTPRSFERVVKTCLAKDRAHRFRSAHDVAIALGWVRDESQEREPAKRGRAGWIAAGVFAVTALVAIGALIARSGRVETPAPVLRTSINPPQGHLFTGHLNAGAPEISPDARKIVFTAESKTTVGGEFGTSALWLRSVDSAEPRMLPGTESGGQPFWSPDSRYVAFHSDGALRRIDISGGAPTVICRTDVYRGGTWNADGTIVFGSAADVLFRVPASGGHPVALTKLDYSKRETTHRFPTFLPGSKRVLFLASDAAFEGHLAVVDLETGQRTDLIAAASSARYFDGWLLYLRDNNLTAQRLDVDGLRLEGEPRPVLEQPIELDSGTARSFFSIAADGTLLYQTGYQNVETFLTWFDRDGKRVRQAAVGDRHGSTALSPDGLFVAYSTSPRRDLWLMEIERGVRRRITFAGGRDYNPVWSPDGTRIAFSSSPPPDRGYDLYILDLRTGVVSPLLVDNEDKVPTSWSKDGSSILYTRRRLSAERDEIEVITLADRKTRPVVGGPFNQANGAFSPDGKWVAYASTDTSPIHVYLSPYPPTGVKWQVTSHPGGGAPRWRGDGKEIFFWSTSGHIASVPVELTNPPKIGASTNRVRVPFVTARRWDVTRNGNLFVTPARGTEEPPPPPLTLVQGFASELAKLDPGP